MKRFPKEIFLLNLFRFPARQMGWLNQEWEIFEPGNSSINVKYLFSYRPKVFRNFLKIGVDCPHFKISRYYCVDVFPDGGLRYILWHSLGMEYEQNVQLYNDLFMWDKIKDDQVRYVIQKHYGMWETSTLPWGIGKPEIPEVVSNAARKTYPNWKPERQRKKLKEEFVNKTCLAHLLYLDKRNLLRDHPRFRSSLLAMYTSISQNYLYPESVAKKLLRIVEFMSIREWPTRERLVDQMIELCHEISIECLYVSMSDLEKMVLEDQGFDLPQLLHSDFEKLDEQAIDRCLQMLEPLEGTELGDCLKNRLCLLEYLNLEPINLRDYKPVSL